MKIAIMQPYFFPYIGYFQVINYVDSYVVYDDVNYIKNGWINRNRILINDKPKYITLSLSKASSFKKINDIDIDISQNTRQKVFSSIYFAYKNAPMFEEVMPILESVINFPDNNLAQYIFFSIKEVCRYLSIDTQLILSSTIKKDNELKKSDKLIQICKILGASEYVNAIGGQALYTKEAFKQHGIELKFLQSSQIQYHQYSRNYVPNLSVIDVLMFNPIDEIRHFLSNFQLI